MENADVFKVHGRFEEISSSNDAVRHKIFNEAGGIPFVGAPE